MASRKRSISKEEDMRALYKQWDEVSCSICMEHPHNAVLLLCSSHDKGCRSYICDTSYRHSNCLDRFRKLQAENGETQSPPSLSSGNQHGAANASGINPGHSSNEAIGSHENHDAGGSVIAEEVNVENSSEAKLNLKCPLCRGTVLGWEVMDEARKYLNLKQRNCSRELCSFTGNYRELRRHARSVHPTARPADIDPSRQRAWRRLENQREYDDIVSAVRSAMPGAIVLGDYVIENGGDRLSGERERGAGDNGRLLNTFFLFQMIGSMDRRAEQRGGRSRALSRHRRSSGAFARRRYLWGENLLGLHEDGNGEDDDDGRPDLNMLADMGDEDVSHNPRRRRRLTRSRSDEDQRP